MPAQYNILKWHQYFVEIQVNAFQLSKICYADLSWIHVLKWNEVSKNMFLGIYKLTESSPKGKESSIF